MGQRGRPTKQNEEALVLGEFETRKPTDGEFTNVDAAEGGIALAFDPDDIADGALEQGNENLNAPIIGVDLPESAFKEAYKEKAASFQEKILMKEPQYKVGNERMAVVLDMLQPYVARGLGLVIEDSSVTIRF